MLIKLFIKMNKYLNDFKEHDDSEILHQLRISIRKIKLILEIFKKSFNKEEFRQLNSVILPIQKSLSDLRDLDVIEIKIIKIAGKHKISMDESLLKAIQKEKKCLRKKCRSQISKINYDSLEIFTGG